jgi:hypothetical protein
MDKKGHKRGVGAAVKGFGAVFSESTEQAKKPEKVDVNFSAQKVHGTIDIPKSVRIPQPTSC